MKNIAIILASGTGDRSGLSLPKQFFEIDGKTLLEIVVTTFNNHTKVDEIIVVVNVEFIELAKELLAGFSKVKKIVEGGATRQESSFNGVMAVDETECNVLIHDAARAFVSERAISTCIDGLEVHKAVCAAVNSTDTVFVVDDDGKIIDIPSRGNLKCAQTPQCFRYSLIKKAHELACEGKIKVTDDCGLVLNSGLGEIYTIEGDTDNRKITYSEDFDFAKRIYKKRLDLKNGSC